MAAGVDFLEIGDGKVRVYLRGSQRGMAEKLLDNTDVGLVLEHGSGARMAEAVRVHVFCDLGLFCIFPHQLP